MNNAINVLSSPDLRKIYDDAQFTTGLGEEAIYDFENHRQPDAYKKQPQFDPSSPLFNPSAPVDIVEKAPNMEIEVDILFSEA